METTLSESGQHSSTNSQPNVDVEYGKSEGRTPCVQYDSESSKRKPTLIPITEPIPDDATVASPIYFLNDYQIERQAQLESPYGITGDHNSIASELQDECEYEGRVSYPIYVESDDIGEKSRYEVYEALHEAVREIFDVAPDDCRWFFSGNRSIHAHLPLVANNEEQLEGIRSIVEEYNEGSDVELDSQIYSRKRMFRLPGVTHRKTGYPKIEIDPNVSERELNQQLVNSHILDSEPRLGKIV